MSAAGSRSWPLVDITPFGRRRRGGTLWAASRRIRRGGRCAARRSTAPGVRSELGESVEIVGEAGTVADAVPLIKQLDPHVVLLDVHLPDGKGDAIINAVAPDRPGVKFLALSVSDAASTSADRVGTRSGASPTSAASACRTCRRALPRSRTPTR